MFVDSMTLCPDPSSKFEGELVLDNNQFVIEGEKLHMEKGGGQIQLATPANVTLNKNLFAYQSVYASTSIGYLPTLCNINDAVPQTFNVIDNLLERENALSGETTTIGFYVETGYYRTVNINIIGNTFNLSSSKTRQLIVQAIRERCRSCARHRRRCTRRTTRATATGRQTCTSSAR